MVLACVTSLGSAFFGTAHAAGAAEFHPVSEDSVARSTAPDDGGGVPISESGPHSFEMPTAPSRTSGRHHAPGGSAGEYHSTPGSGTKSDPDHNYHNDLYGNSESNSNSNSSLAKCGAGNDDTAAREDCDSEDVYGRRHDQRHPYRSEDRDSGGLGSIF